MTVFITRYWRKKLKPTPQMEGRVYGFARLFAIALLLLTLIDSAVVTAQTQQTVELVAVSVDVQDESVVLNAAVQFELNRTMEDALSKGSPLYFVAEVAVIRSRWYWLDETVSEASRTIRIAYEPLLRRYRVSTGGLVQTVDTLNEALALAQRGIRLRLGDRNTFKADERYRAEFSYRLDTTKLPRLFQVGVTAPRDFLLELPPRRIGFKGEDVRKPEPPAPPPPKESLKEPPR
jgi:Domain of unknown function (DUF4390)